MIKTIVKVAIKLTIILSFAVCSGLFLSKVVRPTTYDELDNTKQKVDGFYALEENSIDILGLGTSHLYSALNPGVLNYYTGLSSYDFAGQCQSMEVTYNYLVEALKTQKPELVILDIFGLSEEANKCQIPSSYRVNIQDLKPSMNKFNAYKNLYNEDVLTNMFDLKLYADNLKDIDINDVDEIINHDENYYFGYTIIYPYEYNVITRDEVYANDKVAPSERELRAFNNILDLCEKENIELLVIKTPYFITQEDANIYAYIYDICDQRGIKYIDFNNMLEEIDFKFTLDGDSWHAKANGSYKITKYLAQYIINNFNIQSSNIYQEVYDKLYFETLQVIFKTNTNFDNLIDYLNYYDVTALVNDTKNLFGMDAPLVVYNKGIKYNDSYFVNDKHTVEIKSDSSVFYDNELVHLGYSTETIVVIDNFTGQIIDIISVDERMVE